MVKRLDFQANPDYGGLSVGLHIDFIDPYVQLYLFRFNVVIGIIDTERNAFQWSLQRFLRREGGNRWKYHAGSVVFQCDICGHSWEEFTTDGQVELPFECPECTSWQEKLILNMTPGINIICPECGTSDAITHYADGSHEINRCPVCYPEKDYE